MRITFLGSGGGRFATISQKRMTGGFRIDGYGGCNYHIDPGPGALIRSYQFGFNPTKLDGVFISHSHTDHYNDAEILIEAMTRGMTRENGYIFGSESVCNGYKHWGPAISNYHKSKSKILTLKPGKVNKTENLIVRGSKTIHGDPTGVGFQMRADKINVSYTSDTQYFKNLHLYHENADILIASVLRPEDDSIKGHMCSEDFVKLLTEVKPKLAFMTHFGFKMIDKNPIKEAQWISKESGIKTIAAIDGLTIIINEKNIRDSRYSIIKPRKQYKDIYTSAVEDKNSYLGFNK